MSRPAFRRSSASPPAATSFGNPNARVGSPSAAHPLAGAPFSQPQILHLMKAEFGRARRLEQPLACVVISVDELRSTARDHARTLLAALVQDNTRDYDHLGMVGDDGYLLVLPQTEAGGAQVVAERIRRAFVATDLRPIGQDSDATTGPLTISLGVSAASGGDTLFFDTLLAQAEHACERARAVGGNQVVVFDRRAFAEDAQPPAEDASRVPDRPRA